jgi:hypothetical protein
MSQDLEDRYRTIRGLADNVDEVGFWRGVRGVAAPCVAVPVVLFFALSLCPTRFPQHYPQKTRPPPKPQISGVAGANLRSWFTSADTKQLLNELEAAGLRCLSTPPASDEFAPDLSPRRPRSSADGGFNGAAPSSVGSAAAAAGGNGRRAKSSPGAGEPVVGSSRLIPGALKGVSICLTGSFTLRDDRKGVDAYLRKVCAWFGGGMEMCAGNLVHPPPCLCTPPPGPTNAP